MPTPVALNLKDAGYEASLRLERTGIRLAVTHFAVAEYATDYTPVSSDTELRGTILYRGLVEEVQVNRKGDRIYKCKVPEDSDPGIIYEFGLYTSDGTLFASGVFDPRYDKTTQFQLRIYGYLRVPVDNRSVEFEAIQLPEIPVAPNYCDLPAANIAGPNAYIVLNGHCGTEAFDNYAPTMVCKWKSGDEWAIIAGSLAYTGGIDSMDTVEGTWVKLPFGKYPAATTDFAMLSVTDGPGRYQCRHVAYDAVNERFNIVDEPLSIPLSPNGVSKISIWAGAGCCGGTAAPVTPYLALPPGYVVDALGQYVLDGDGNIVVDA